MTDTRIVLIIGNVGTLPAEAVEQALAGINALKESLGLAGIVIFEGDIDLAAVTPAGVAPSQAAPTSHDGHR